MKRILCMVWMTILLLTAAFAAAEDAAMTVIAPEVTTGYQENIFTVHCPEAGELTFLFYDENGRLLYKMPAVTAAAGANEVCWDGLGAWDKPLPQGICRVRCVLTAGKAEMNAEATFEIGKPEQALVFALSSDPMFDPARKDWSITYKLIRSGSVVIEVWQEGNTDAPLKTFVKQAANGEPTTWAWKGTVNGKRVPDGNYIVRMYAQTNPDYVHEVRVTIAALEKPIVEPTGKLMPERAADISACAAAPAVAASGRNDEALKIYRQPDTGSKVLGRIDTEAQCVEVHSIEGNWAEVSAYRQEDGELVHGYCRTNKLAAVPVHEEYVLVVDRKESVMNVWQRGELIGSVPVTLGCAAEGYPERETISGSFITGKRTESVSVADSRFSYAIRIGDSFALYQADPSVHDGPTRGDIAVADSTDESTLSAYWLWTHIPPNTRLIIMDDPQSRLIRVACAAAGTRYAPDEWKVYEPVEVQDGENEIILTFGGDVSLASREKWMSQQEAFPAYVKKYGLAYPLEGMQSLFASDHMTIVNLEGVLKADGKGENTGRLVRLRGLPEWVDALPLGSVEHVNIANNHHEDYGAAGKESTIAALNAAGIPFSGFGAVYIAEIEGHRIGFAGCREAMWLHGGQDIAAEIAYLRENGCEVVVYSCHWGTEYAPTHNETQETMAQAVIDAGADIIIGHHPHIVQGMDVIDGVPVVYSLGNLMFGGTHAMKTFDGAVARVSLRFDDEGYSGASITMIPVMTSSSADVWVNDYHPVFAEGQDAMRILALIQADSSVVIQDEMFFPAR